MSPAHIPHLNRAALRETQDATRRVIGECGGTEVDAKLWRGASAQGWAVFCTRDGHRTYTAPDGRKLARKTDAHEWRAGAGCLPPKRRRALKLAPAEVTLSSPLLLLTSTESAPAASTESVVDDAASAAVRARLVRIGLEQYAQPHAQSRRPGRGGVAPGHRRLGAARAHGGPPESGAAKSGAAGLHTHTHTHTHRERERETAANTSTASLAVPRSGLQAQTLIAKQHGQSAPSSWPPLQQPTAAEARSLRAAFSARESGPSLLGCRSKAAATLWS